MLSWQLLADLNAANALTKGSPIPEGRPMPTTTDTQPRAPHRSSDAHVYDAAARLAAEATARGEAAALVAIATRADLAEGFLDALGPAKDDDALAQSIRDRLAGEANAYGMALAYALGVTHPADTLTPCDRDKLAQYVLALQTA